MSRRNLSYGYPEFTIFILPKMQYFVPDDQSVCVVGLKKGRDNIWKHSLFLFYKHILYA